MENNGKKKRGRPKIKNGKSVTLFLSFDCITKLESMTTVSRNKSGFVEILINEKFQKIKEDDKINGAKERKRFN